MRFGMGLGLGLGSRGGDGFNPALYTWVATDGNDSTGDGTYDAPYATITKIRTLTPALTGTKATIYVKPGTYAESQHNFTKAYTYVAYGDVTLRSTSGAIVYGGYANSNSTLSGFKLDAQNARSFITMENNSGLAAGIKLTLVNCQFLNPKTDSTGIMMGPFSNVELEMISCAFTGDYGTGFLLRSAGTAANPISNTIKFRSCTINITAAPATYGAIACYGNATTGTGTDTLLIDGCTIYKNTGESDIYFVRRGTCTITHNTFIYTQDVNKRLINVTINGPTDSVWPATITFSNNIIQMGEYAFTSTLKLIDIGIPTGTVDVVIDNNNITSTSTTAFSANNATCRIIEVSSAKSAYIRGNTIDFRYSRALTGALDLTMISVQNAVNGLSNPGPYVISGNVIHHVGRAGYAITAGADSLAIDKNTLPGVLLEKNVVYGSGYYGYDPGEYKVHTLYVAWQDDYVIRYNTMIGCDHGIVTEGHNTNDGAIIAYNTFIDIAGYSILMSGSSNAVIIGNTIINRTSRGGGGCLLWLGWNYQYGALNEETNPAITGLILKNNILYAPEQLLSSAYAILLMQNTTFAENGCDNNVIYYPTSSTIYAALGKAADGTVLDSYTLTEWLALADYDANSLVAVPQLAAIIADVLTANVDPRPIAGSNVIGIGANLGTDYDDAIDIVSMPPSITTKTQPASPTLWTVGAFVR